MKRFIKNLLFFFGIIKKEFYIEPFIYINENGTLYKGIGNRVRWLDKLTIKAHSENAADKIAIEQLNQKYPQYKGHISLF